MDGAPKKTCADLVSKPIILPGEIARQSSASVWRFDRSTLKAEASWRPASVFIYALSGEEPMVSVAGYSSRTCVSRALLLWLFRARRSAATSRSAKPRGHKSRTAELVGRAHVRPDDPVVRPRTAGQQSDLQSPGRNRAAHASHARRRLSLRLAEIRFAHAFRHRRVPNHNSRRGYFVRIAGLESRSNSEALSRIEFG